MWSQSKSMLHFQSPWLTWNFRISSIIHRMLKSSASHSPSSQPDSSLTTYHQGSTKWISHTWKKTNAYLYPFPVSCKAKHPKTQHLKMNDGINVLLLCTQTFRLHFMCSSEYVEQVKCTWEPSQTSIKVFYALMNKHWIFSIQTFVFRLHTMAGLSASWF